MPTGRRPPRRRPDGFGTDGTNGGPSLAHLVRTLGPQILQPVCAPHGDDVLVADPVIAGPGEDLSANENAVLLLVGGVPDHPPAIGMLAAAAKAGYSAVIVKGHPATLDVFARAAEDIGVALLATPDDVPWRHLESLVAAATAAVGPPVGPYTSVAVGDLFALANAVASRVGGAVTIEDPQGEVLAYSNLPHQGIDDVRTRAILGRQTPDRPENREEYRRVCRATAPVRFTDIGGPDYLDRLAVAVRAGSQLLGIIWVLDGRPKLGPGARPVLETAARVTATHLLRARRDPEKWRRAEALRSLLDGDTTGRIAAGQLGVASDVTSVVLAVGVTGADTPGVAIARLVDLVGLFCESWHPDALCTSGGGVVYALVPLVSTARAQEPLRRLAKELVSSARRSAEISVRVGIGAVATELDEVPASRRSADRVLRVLADDARDRADVATVDDVRSKVALLELSDHASGFIDALSGPAQQFLEYDARHGTPYAESMLAFLDAFGDVARAAAALHVHANTLRYRVRRAQEIFDIDLASPEDRLVLWFQLRLRDLAIASRRTTTSM